MVFAIIIANASTTLEGGPAAHGASNVTLYFTMDGALAAASPAKEGFVPLTTPFNSPMTGNYPKWHGPLPVALAKARNVTLHLFVTSSSVNVAAGALPMFAGLPAMDATVGLGNASGSAAVRGPDVVKTGEVVELTADVTLPNATSAPAGTTVDDAALVYYLHAAGAAEFRYVIGGSAHASRMEWGAMGQQGRQSG